MTESTVGPSSAVSASSSSHSADVGSMARARALRNSMECVVLAARPGAAPSPRPPVEIFLGTEPAQYRANRVLGWSIEKVRDPGREVRIYLMSELDGFDRRGWTTGFTNFRFAIPAYQGGVGRAIYNDEDQIYLTDPGELFDLDLGDAAHLSISDTESSVMLIDCAKMASVWTLEEAQHRWKRALLRKASKDTGLRGDLDPGWNARDEEFKPGESHLLHYTTLHTQPWRPFPERFIYQKGSHTQLWHDLEREAIANGFEIFSRDAPSRGFESRLEDQRALPHSEMGSGIGVPGDVAEDLENLARHTKSRTQLELLPDLSGDAEERPGRFGLESERRVGLLQWLEELDEDSFFDGMICVDGLEALPVWDIPWLVDALFQKASRFVFVAVRCPESSPRRRFLLPPQGTTHTPEWWRTHFEAAASRHPEISWELITTRGAAFEPERIHVRRGGPRVVSTPPSVWTLTDGEPGNETQVAALVSSLGWPSKAVTPVLGSMADLPFADRGSHLRGLRTVGGGLPSSQTSWPDLLIVAGRRVAPMARWVRRESRGRTLVVAIGAKAATPAEDVDLAVTRRGVALFPHPHRFEIDRPLVSAVRARPVSARWQERIAGISGPRIAVLLGSGTRRLGLDRAAAESLGKLVAESAVGMDASILVSASRHAASEVFEGCLRGLGNVALVHHETPDQRPNERAWPAILDGADIFVLAGLGETTLAEICATGRPVFLSPQLRSRPSLGSRIHDRAVDAIFSRAEARPANDRGTTRPQQRLELLCARLVAGGWVRPRRDFEALRGRLVRDGQARLLRAPIRAQDLKEFKSAAASDVDSVAARVRQILGVDVEKETGRDATNDL
jgi:mitochondrial fission protein ELM1